MRHPRRLSAALLLLALGAGCTDTGATGPRPSGSRSVPATAASSSSSSSSLQSASPVTPPGPAQPSRTPVPSGSASAGGTPGGSPAASPTTTRPRVEPVRPEIDRVVADIERLAGDIGPRETTSDAFDEAADLVQRRFTGLGYQVSSKRVRVPAGDSWGVPVEAGTSRSVIASPPGFDADDDHLVIGAHLDTVAVAPGAEDNASGVAMVLELARLASAEDPRLPVRFIVFGAEEPRGQADDQHHFGSRAVVDDLGPAERRAVQAMVSLDRVGVGTGRVPVCASPRGGAELRRQLRRTGRSVDVRTESCVTTSSDHWSYAKAGIPAVRIGGVPYAAYHSPADTPEVINPDQLRRVGRLVQTWIERHAPR